MSCERRQERDTVMPGVTMLWVKGEIIQIGFTLSPSASVNELLAFDFRRLGTLSRLYNRSSRKGQIRNTLPSTIKLLPRIKQQCILHSIEMTSSDWLEYIYRIVIFT